MMASNPRILPEEGSTKPLKPLAYGELCLNHMNQTPPQLKSLPAEFEHVMEYLDNTLEKLDLRIELHSTRLSEENHASAQDLLSSRLKDQRSAQISKQAQEDGSILKKFLGRASRNFRNQ